MKQMYRMLAYASVCLLFLFMHAGSAAEKEPLRIGLAAVFIDEPRTVIDRWADYLEERLEQPVEFVQRRTYGEITAGLLKGGLDAGWICTYPYVTNREQLRLLVVPVYRGQSNYRSYLIVSAKDRDTRDITDLRGKSFAYTDTQSLTGYIVPRRWLREAGLDQDHFFRTTFFTWSHRDSIEAVAEGVADAAAVDSYIWESLNRSSPDITERTRVVSYSEDYGFPPLVASLHMDATAFLQLQRALLGMKGDPEGKWLLQAMNLDGFETPDESLYRGALKYLQESAD